MTTACARHQIHNCADCHRSDEFPAPCPDKSATEGEKGHIPPPRPSTPAPARGPGPFCVTDTSGVAGIAMMLAGRNHRICFVSEASPIPAQRIADALNALDASEAGTAGSGGRDAPLVDSLEGLIEALGDVLLSCDACLSPEAFAMALADRGVYLVGATEASRAERAEHDLAIAQAANVTFMDEAAVLRRRLAERKQAGTGLPEHDGEAVLAILTDEEIAAALNAVEQMTCSHCHDLGNAHTPDCPAIPIVEGVTMETVSAMIGAAVQNAVAETLRRQARGSLG